MAAAANSGKYIRDYHTACVSGITYDSDICRETNQPFSDRNYAGYVHPGSGGPDRFMAYYETRLDILCGYYGIFYLCGYGSIWKNGTACHKTDEREG